MTSRAAPADGLRIVYVHQYFRTPEHSGGTRSFEFARRLVAHGHRVDVLTTATPDEAPGDQRAGTWFTTTEAGARVHWCVVDYSNRMGYAARIRAFAEFALRASIRVSRLPRDLVLASSTPLTVGIPAVWGARTGRVPMVFEVRDVWPEVPIALGALRRPWSRRLAHALEGWIYRHAAHVVALSPDMAASITRRHPRTRVTVIPNSSDVELFAVPASAGAEVRARRAWLAERPLVLYTGTFGLVNGLSYLIHTAAAMRDVDPEVRFLLVGTGREEDELRTLAGAEGVLAENLFIEPPVPKRDLPALLSAADLCVSTVIDVPELAANSANKAFDAFAAGRPLLINHEGWLAETLRSSGAGIVVPPDDPPTAARRIAACLREPAWVAGARDAASHLATTRFHRDLLFADLLDVLRATTDGPHDAGSGGSRDRGLRLTVRRRRPAERCRRSRAKVAVDRVASAAALVLCSPMLLALAARVLFADGRPVLFVQDRAGLDGTPFRMLKFRTMLVGSVELSRQWGLTDDPYGIVENDPRITRTGHFLRRTSLDELPQLLNVLRGEMSLVGPRPDVVPQVDLYTPRERRRLGVRPGITGWVQVNGRDELPWQDRFVLDEWYIDHWSLLLDARILGRTVRALWRRDPTPALVDDFHVRRRRERSAGRVDEPASADAATPDEACP